MGSIEKVHNLDNQAYKIDLKRNNLLKEVDKFEENDMKILCRTKSRRFFKSPKLKRIFKGNQCSWQGIKILKYDYLF